MLNSKVGYQVGDLIITPSGNILLVVARKNFFIQVHNTFLPISRGKEFSVQFSSTNPKFSDGAVAVPLV